MCTSMISQTQIFGTTCFIFWSPQRLTRSYTKPNADAVMPSWKTSVISPCIEIVWNRRCSPTYYMVCYCLVVCAKKRWLVSEMFCSTELTSSSQVQHFRKVRVWTVGLLVVTLLGIHVISLSTRHFSSASTKIQPTLSLQSWKRKCLCCFIRTQRV